MKSYRVVLYIGNDTQWIVVVAKNVEEAKKQALANIQVLSVTALD